MQAEQTEVIYDSKGEAASFVRVTVPVQEVRASVSKAVARKYLFKELLQSTHAGVRSRVPWALINGDAKKSLEKLPDVSVDCVVTSPPY